jgi:putative peptidoglycan lipid II flippase
MVEGGTSGFLPGAVIAGRYRLLASHGNRPLLQFWHAVDGVSGREVALTLVDPARELPEEFVHEILARTVRLKGICAAGVARVLDVLHTGAFGVVICEWIPGGSLWEIARTAPSPTASAGAMQSLAEAAEEAHRAGLALSIDDPSRLRVSSDGHAALAFPATMPDASPQADLRGIGCALYTLLLNRWPTPDEDPEELAATNPEIPFLISTTAAALLRRKGGIASAATALTLLRQAGADAMGEANCRVMAPLPPPPPGFYATFRGFGPAERREAARGYIIRTALAAAAAIVLVAVLSLASTVNGILGDNDDVVTMDADQLGLIPQTPTPGQPPSEQKRAASPTNPVTPASAVVFSPDGSPDSPREAGLAIDGKPDTAWPTDRYYDSDPFPKFKSGVGLLLQLPQPTSLSAVTVELNSLGTVVQVRGSDGPAPKTLADTRELSAPTPMRPGQNRIPMGDPKAVSHVVVWIATLGSTDGQNRAAISEIRLHSASPPA